MYVQVQILFKDAPDLLAEFKDFLPEVAGGLTHPGNAPMSQGAASTAQYADVPVTGSPDKGAKKTNTSGVKRKKRTEKEPTPVPHPPKPAPSRVKEH